MVKLNYLSKEEAEEKINLREKKKEVKGLAKKFFGFWRVKSSISDDAICLNSFFNSTLNADIGTIDLSDNSMRLFNKKYQEKAELFAKAYEERFMEGEDFVIDYKYSCD